MRSPILLLVPAVVLGGWMPSLRPDDARAAAPPARVALQQAAAQPDGAIAAPPVPARSFDASRLVPLPQVDSYQGFRGGLYPDGRNEPPVRHRMAGMEMARAIQPRGTSGRPDPAGKIVLLSIGMSNTAQEFAAFQRLVADDPEVNRAVVAVNGAQGGMTAARIVDPEDGTTGSRFWETIDTRLQAQGLSRAQVQAVWIKQANARPAGTFPEHARELQRQLDQIVRILNTRFPRLRVAYLSSRIYGGYARTPLNPEPYAYESGFAVKWLIEDQIQGDGLNFMPEYGPVTAPWLAWGPYLWANDGKPNSRGIAWTPEDFEADGTHPSPQGEAKVARALLEFFKTEPTARVWFLRAEARS